MRCCFCTRSNQKVRSMLPLLCKRTSPVNSWSLFNNVATDSPSGKFFSEMLMICPNIRSMMLDPVHLAIVYEYGFWNKKSPGSKQLRKLLRKTTALDTEVGENYWGSFYNGDMSRPLNEQESKYRDMILSFSMPTAEAGVIFDEIVDHRPFYDRLEFI